MNNKTFFWHSSTARKDPRAVKMTKLLGFSAYGVYWEIVSIIYQSGGKCEINHILHHSNLCNDLSVGSSHLRCIILDFDLFEYDKTHVWFKLNETMHHDQEVPL